MKYAYELVISATKFLFSENALDRKRMMRNYYLFLYYDK